MNSKSKTYKLNIAFIAVFMALVIGVGSFSFLNLMNTYISGKSYIFNVTEDDNDILESNYSDSLVFHDTFLNINGIMRNILNQKEMNGIVKLNNGYLTEIYPYVNDSEIDDKTSNIMYLNNYLNDKEIDFLYAVAPYTVNKYDPQLPIGIVDYGNNNVDRMVESLKSKNINTMDFREIFYQNGIDQYDMMYRTDHHWTTGATLFAYGELEKYINSKQNCTTPLEVSDVDSYDMLHYENWFIGTRAMKSAQSYGSIDDFDIYVPRFSTNIQNSKGDTGKLEELAINIDGVSTHTHTYESVYDIANDDFINLDHPNDVRLLIIADSFSKPLMPFLISAYSEVHFIQSYELDKLTKDYLEDYNPDEVIILLFCSNCVSFTYDELLTFKE